MSWWFLIVVVAGGAVLWAVLSSLVWVRQHWRRAHDHQLPPEQKSSEN